MHLFFFFKKLLKSKLPQLSMKIQSQESIQKIIIDLREKNPNIVIVTTNGSFDILHIGHLKSLQQAKSEGNVLIVLLNSDSSIKEYKSPDRPINKQEDRAEMLAALECVDYIVIFDETTPNKILDLVKPNVHVKSKSGYLAKEKDILDKHNIKLVLLDDLPGISTTKILEKLSKN